MANAQTGSESIDISKPQIKDGTQTPPEPATPTPQGQPGADGDQGTGGQEEGAGEGEKKDDINPDTGQPYTLEEWRDKFRASAKGANELLDANKALELDIARVRDDGSKTLKEKEAEIAALRAVAEGKNPDGLSLLDLQKKYGEVSGELSSMRENKNLDDFLASTKIAGSDSFKETLRALARSNPHASLATLWDANLKAGAEAAAAAAKLRDTTRKGSASDSGKGTSSREHKGETVGNTGMSLAEFNALPVAKRQALLVKEGY